MSTWRRKAIEAFPELRRELGAKDEIYSVYALWFELLPLAQQAHRDGDDELLRRIYGYAKWCSRQQGDLGNAVGVAFYEHLFDEAWMRPLVVRWLDEQVISDDRPLWEFMLSAESMAEVDRLLESRPVA